MGCKITLTFLGTGDAKPTVKRNHTGILISYANENLLFDCGENIQRQFRLAHLNPCKLTRIFITHWHGDHTFGLLGILSTLEKSEYSKALQIYGPKNTKRNIELFEKIYGQFKINYTVHEISDGLIINERDFSIHALPMSHGIPTIAYSLMIKPKLRLDKKKLAKLKLPNSPLLAKLQQGKNITHPKTKKKIRAKDLTYTEKGKKITIIMDTKMNPNTIKLARDSDLLICESTFASDNARKAREYKHLTSQDAATIAKKAKVKKLILTHISQRYQKDNSIILEEAKKIFKTVSVAKDLDKLLI